MNNVLKHETIITKLHTLSAAISYCVILYSLKYILVPQPLVALQTCLKFAYEFTVVVKHEVVPHSHHQHKLGIISLSL